MGSTTYPDPELLPARKPVTKEELLYALTQLYALNFPAIQGAERALEDVHRNYLMLISPVSDKLLLSLEEGAQLAGEDVVQGLHLRSAWMVEEIRRIRKAYERQFGTACNLAKLL